jgi:desulfoferrodoxin (superoxide reductase-like protein)
MMRGMPGKIWRITSDERWEKGKHALVIECAGSIKSGEKLEIKVWAGSMS